MIELTGLMFLSRKQLAQASIAADGTFALRVLAFDRQGPLEVEAYQITWSGPVAQAFWAMHADELKPGAAVQVVLTRLRLHTTTGRHTVAQLIAEAKSLQVLAKEPI